MYIYIYIYVYSTKNHWIMHLVCFARMYLQPWNIRAFSNWCFWKMSPPKTTWYTQGVGMILDLFFIVVKNHPICTQRHIGVLFFSFLFGSSRVLDMLRMETYHRRCLPRTKDTCARYLNPINRYKQSLQSI